VKWPYATHTKVFVLSFVVGGIKVDMEYISELISSGETNTTPTPEPFSILDPSKNMV
jgi:hypothetical protein